LGKLKFFEHKTFEVNLSESKFWLSFFLNNFKHVFELKKIQQNNYPSAAECSRRDRQLTFPTPVEWGSVEHFDYKNQGSKFLEKF